MWSRPVHVRLIAALVAALVVLIGCSGVAEEDQEAFCQDTEAFLGDDAVTQAANFSEQFFADVDQRLASIEATAPDEIRDAVVTLRAGFTQSDRIFAEFDYDLTDPELVSALDRIDQASMLTATENIEAYLVSDCGLAPDRPVDDAAVTDIMTAFSVDRDLAQCLYRELGDVANIDSSDLTTELMTREVCGTSLLGLLNGTGAGP